MEIRRKIKLARKHLRNGKRFGYPRCCVRAFAWDYWWGRSPGMLRGSIILERGFCGFLTMGYVPCRRCLSRSAAERDARLRARRA